MIMRLTGMAAGAALAIACTIPSAAADLPGTNYQYRLEPPASRAAWDARRAELKRQILLAAGLEPMPAKTPLKARVWGRKVYGEVAVEKVLLETMPGFFLGGNLYRPAKARGKRPAVLNPHGHWKHGRLEDTDEYSGPSLGYNLARLGFVVFAYDMIGYNDTRQFDHDFGNSDEDRLWRFHAVALQLWNSIRALDFVGSLPDVDPERIAATGASGGGTQTFLLGAVDERLRVSVPVNMISAHFQGGCTCENAPGLRWDTQNVEIAAVFAPKPMLMVAATGDWTRDTPKVEYPAMQAYYRLYQAAGNLEMYQQEAKHNYNRASREAVYRFLAKRLLRDSHCAKCAEQPHPFGNVDALRAAGPEGLPENALTGDAIRGLWKETRRAAALQDPPEVVSDRLMRTLGVVWPDGNALDAPLAMVKGDARSATVVVHPDGAAAAREWRQSHHQTSDNSTLVFVDKKEPLRNTGAHHLTFHRAEDALRVQEILSALAYLRAQGYEDIRLVGVKRAAVWSVFAAAVSPVKVRLNARLSGFDGTDEDFVRDFNVPGIQLAGGLRAALRLLKTNGVAWGEPHVDGAQ